LPSEHEGERRRRAIDSHEEGGTWWLIDHELVPAAEAYLRAHREVLVQQ
jgi:hypothetical protein